MSKKQQKITVHRHGPGYEVKYQVVGNGAAEFANELKSIFDKIDDDEEGEQ